MELLSDPLKDRQVKNLKPPPHKPLEKQFLWPEKLKSTKILNYFEIYHFYFR